MIRVYDLQMETQGGIGDLGRVVDVLALLDLTPLAFTYAPHGTGLKLAMRLQGEDRACRLCASRLGALVALAPETLKIVTVKSATQEPACI